MTTTTDLAARLRGLARVETERVRDMLNEAADALEAAQKARGDVPDSADMESLCLLAFSEEDGYGYEARAKFDTFRDGFFACARRLKERTTAPQSGDGWMPIETAPKDGRDFFAIEAYSLGTPDYSVCYWHELVRRFVAPDERFDPTHWRPLPPPPAMEADSLLAADDAAEVGVG